MMQCVVFVILNISPFYNTLLISHSTQMQWLGSSKLISYFRAFRSLNSCHFVYFVETLTHQLLLYLATQVVRCIPIPTKDLEFGTSGPKFGEIHPIRSNPRQTQNGLTIRPNLMFQAIPSTKPAHNYPLKHKSINNTPETQVIGYFLLYSLVAVAASPSSLFLSWAFAESAHLRPWFQIGATPPQLASLAHLFSNQNLPNYESLTGQLN